MPPREEKTTGTKPNPWEAQPAACLAVLLACDWRKRVCYQGYGKYCVIKGMGNTVYRGGGVSQKRQGERCFRTSYGDDGKGG